MARKRTRKLTLVLLGVAGALTAGCGNKQAVAPVGVAGGEDHPAARLDEATAKRVVAASTATALSDGYAHASAILAGGPVLGSAAPLNLARLAYLTDQAAETYDVAANQAQIPPHSTPGYTPRHHYHYHRGPGIGWFIFGYSMGRMFSGPRSYTPPPYYGGTPRPLNPSYGNRSHIPRPSSGGGGAGGVAGSRGPVTGGSRSPSTGGGVSRGGFGGVGGGHATGGS